MNPDGELSSFWMGLLTSNLEARGSKPQAMDGLRLRLSKDDRVVVHDDRRVAAVKEEMRI